MAWTTPKTIATNDVGVAADWNTYIRDNTDAAAGANKAACRVYNSGVLSINNNTLTVLTFDSERFDRQSCHSTVSNTGRITVPTGWGGLWLVGAHISWAANATGHRELGIRLNGTTILGESFVQSVTTSNPTNQSVSTLYAVSATDFFEVVVGQTSGGSLNVAASGNFSPEFWAYWVSA